MLINLKADLGESYGTYTISNDDACSVSSTAPTSPAACPAMTPG